MDDDTDTAVLTTWDYVAIVIYFIIVVGAAVYALFTTNRGTVSGYFLAGRFMTWLPVGASIFGSNIGSEHFVGLAGDAAAGGLTPGAFELNALGLLQLMGFLFIPVYIASGVCTLPEFMMKRFGGRRIRVYLACMSIFVYIVARISVDLYSGALFIQQALGWNQYLSIVLILVFVGIFTLTGGLAAVMYTDTVQVFIMLIGGFILMILSFIEIGGFQSLKVKYFQAISNETLNTPNYTCGYPNPNAFQMLRDPHPFNSDFPWVGFVIGQTMTSITYFCAEQVMVQRTLSAKSLSHAQGGCIFAGYIKILPLFMIVIPGMIARVLYADTVACASAETCLAACGNPKGCTNTAFPSLVLGVMPSGLRGMMLAVMLAAIVSSLTSFFNSISTLFTVDIWLYFRQKFAGKEPSVRELMIVGRVIVVVMVGLSICWIPAIELLQGGDGLNRYFTRIAGRITPSVCAVYLLAILWPRANEMGTFWGLIAGAFTGFTRLILDFIWPAPVCWEEDNRPYILKMHYFYFNMILFAVVFTVDIVVSLLTEPPPPERLIRTTFWTRFSKAKRSDEQEFEDDDDSGDGKDDVQTMEMKVPTEQGTEKAEKGQLYRALSWFCGYEADSEDNQRKARQQEKRIREITTSIEQDPRAKTFIYVNMAILLGVSVFLYTFFSTDWI
ncbi:sodium/glucose cotransporter 4-like [Diadema antillarum]|uniref:sodium/glucose cotransporter 4-like n=1 Tax=Diadema antillarum TaxID=105358 RepID=UPI003A83DDF7